VGEEGGWREGEGGLSSPLHSLYGSGRGSGKVRGATPTNLTPARCSRRPGPLPVRARARPRGATMRTAESAGGMALPPQPLTLPLPVWAKKGAGGKVRDPFTIVEVLLVGS